MGVKKLGKVLYFLSRNSRITTKELGKLLRVSQQSASYLVQNLFQKKILQNYQTVIDPARFGLINIVVLYHYQNFESRALAKLKAHLMSHPHIVTVEEVSHGADLMVEFSVPNLSLFNKQHRELLHDYRSMLRIADIQVVIVKHLYERKYMAKSTNDSQIILSGDRDVMPLNNRQKAVLQLLHQNAKEPVINIARNLNLDSKTVVSIKKQLESKRVIRKYSILLNYPNADISRRYLLLRLDYEDSDEINKVVEYAKQHKNIVELVKIIGDYELLMVIETESLSKGVINDLRRHFSVSDYKIIESDNLLKQCYVPESLFE